MVESDVCVWPPTKLRVMGPGYVAGLGTQTIW